MLAIGGGDPTDNQDCESTPVSPAPPTLAVTKTSTATEIAPGAEIPYVITVEQHRHGRGARRGGHRSAARRD